MQPAACVFLSSVSKRKLKVVLAGGHGPEEEYEQIQQLAIECRYPVQFLGMLSQAELAEQFRQSDVFILPSFLKGWRLSILKRWHADAK